MYMYIYNVNSCYVYRHRLLFHLHSFTPSQLHSFTASQLPYSDRGWVLNRAHRQRSCNAPLGTRHAMTIQRRLQRCPKMSLFSVVIRLRTTETALAFSGQDRDGS